MFESNCVKSDNQITSVRINAGNNISSIMIHLPRIMTKIHKFYDVFRCILLNAETSSKYSIIQNTTINELSIKPVPVNVACNTINK